MLPVHPFPPNVYLRPQCNIYLGKTHNIFLAFHITVAKCDLSSLGEMSYVRFGRSCDSKKTVPPWQAPIDKGGLTKNDQAFVSLGGGDLAYTRSGRGGT